MFLTLYVLKSKHINAHCHFGFSNFKDLERPWIWKQKFKALNVLEFVKKYFWKSLNSSCFSMDIFWNCLTFKTDILLNWFCMFISDKAVGNSLKLRFEQFNVTFYLFLTPSLRYLVLEFADICPWMTHGLDPKGVWEGGGGGGRYMVSRKLLLVRFNKLLMKSCAFVILAASMISFCVAPFATAPG